MNIIADCEAEVERLATINATSIDNSTVIPTCDFNPNGLIDAYDNDAECSETKLMENIVFWSLCFVYIGVFNFIGYPTFAYMFGKAGEELTSRLRYRSFKV